MFGTGTQWGFIAQEVEALVDKEAALVTAPQTDEGEYGLQYMGLVAPLVLAVQQLSEKCSELEARLS